MSRIARPKPRLDVRDLELVLALAGSGSTVGAAEQLNLTQPAVSRGLLLAEEKMGTRLFDRHARGLAPTAAGERLVSGAGALLGRLVELEASVKAPVAEPTRIRLVCECYTAYRWLPSALMRLRQDMPGLDVSLALEHAGSPVSALRDGVVDVALLTTAEVRAPLVEQPLFSDEIVFVMSNTHPLAARRTIERQDLTRYRLIGSTQTPPPEARWFFTQVFGRARPKLDFLRLPLTEAIVDTARAGLGIAVLSEWIAGPYLEDRSLTVRRLLGRPLRRPWRIAFRREVSSTAMRLGAALEHAAPRAYDAGARARAA
jgi:LysR family transcriptional regulator, regulator for metE and metH